MPEHSLRGEGPGQGQVPEDRTPELKEAQK